ncbi:MAG: ATP-binding protein [Cyanobacteria bacterium J06627_28]
MRITTKFIGSSALLIVLTLLLSGSRYAVSRRQSELLDASYDQTLAISQSVMEIETALYDQINSLSRFAVLPESADELAQYEQAHRQFNEQLAALGQMVPPEERVFHTQILGVQQQHDYLGLLHERLTEQLTVASQSTDGSVLEERWSAEQMQEIVRSLQLYERQTGAYIQDFLRHVDNRFVEHDRARNLVQQRAAVLDLITFSVLLISLLAQYYFFLRPVIKSLSVLQAGTDRIGRGDDFAIALQTGDELQTLAVAFNQMGTRLTESYRELEQRVADRTSALNSVNAALLQEVDERTAAETNLSQALMQLKQTQMQLLQTEKMSSLSQLVAGVAHEINNPVSFIQGNLEPARNYADDLLALLRCYQAECPEASPELSKALEAADLPFIQSDFPQLLDSIKNGAERITTIVRSLQTFSHLDESATKAVDLHEGLESTLLILASQLSATSERPAIDIVRQYSELPKVYCYPGQLNQVFMNILTNAVDALDALTVEAASLNASSASSTNTPGSLADRQWPRARTGPTITLATQADEHSVRITIADNGMGMTDDVRKQAFDPFFTTKPVGNGTGLGLSMSYQIVTLNHQGTLSCESKVGVGTVFTVEIPLNLKIRQQAVEEVPIAEPTFDAFALDVI